jgi:hypothetical protein
MTPSGNPSISAISIAATASCNVTGQLGRHRKMCDEGAPEVALNEVAEEAQVLLGEGLVQAKLGAQLEDRLRGRVLPEHQRRRIAWRDLHEQEDGDRHDEQQGHRDEQPAEDVGDHRAGLTVAGRSRAAQTMVRSRVQFDRYSTPVFVTMTMSSIRKPPTLKS